MRIANVSAHIVRAALDRLYWMSLEPYSEASEILVEITLDDGTTGIGEIHGRPMEKIVELLRAVSERIIGRDPLGTESIWADLFACAHSRSAASLHASSGQPHFGGGVRPQLMAAIAGIDIALWDLKGKILGQPVWRLLGGGRADVPGYASGGYYGPNGEAAIGDLVEEMRSYVEQGFTAVKMKTGGLSIPEDLERLRAVRECAGPKVRIILDANQAYDVNTAIRAGQAFSEYDIEWFEEPVRWYDAVFGLKQVANALDIPIASGESEIHRWGCRDLIEHGGARIMQFDATRAGGVTEWLKVAAHAACHDVLMAPHHDAQIHGHLVAAVPNGHVLEVFPNARRDPLWQDLFVDRPEIRDSRVYLSDAPGFGFGISAEGLKKYGVRAF